MVAGGVDGTAVLTACDYGEKIAPRPPDESTSALGHEMKVRRGIGTAAFVLLLALAPAAQADTVVNPFSGQWNTQLDARTGTVKFSAILTKDGVPALQAMGGQPCAAPTTYYHGDFANGSPFLTGTMTGCTKNTGHLHLVGRWKTASPHPGSFDIALSVNLDQSQHRFDGSYAADTGVTFPYSGTFGSHFPGDGCCTAGGGGGGLALPTTFCPGSAGDRTGPAAHAAECALKKFATKQEKAQALRDVHDLVRIAALFCAGIAIPDRPGDRFLVCAEAIEAAVEALRISQLPTEPLKVAPDARPAASGCPKGLTTTQCAALNAALLSYAGALAVTASTTGNVADGANKVTESVQINHPASAFFQAAFAKVNEGVMVADLLGTQRYGQAVANLLIADHLDVHLSSRQAKNELSNLPASVLPKSERKLFLRQLNAISGPVSSTVLGAPLATSAFAAHYRSISLSDLAALVYGLWRNGHYSQAVEQTLTADLVSAQNACSNASQRTAAMQHFVSDVLAQAGSYGSFLKFGAQPLLAAGVPAASCR
jgi:hypothetical protein